MESRLKSAFGGLAWAQEAGIGVGAWRERGLTVWRGKVLA